jgi:5-methylcytosine-specific restriction endonuclease McrA
MNNKNPDPNLFCKSCGCKERKDLEKHQFHHIIPISIGGTDMDGRICLCKKCHDIIHLQLLKILWPYVINKGGAKHSIMEFTKIYARLAKW